VGGKLNMSTVRNDNFVCIQGWMVNELNLSGNKLMTYALIYGITQDGDSEFTGSAQYIADWCNCSKRTIISVLSSLVEDGLLIKTECIKNNMKFCNYKVSITKNRTYVWGGEKISPLVKKFHGGGEKISPPSEKISLGGGEKISLHNIDNNTIKDNIDKNIAKNVAKKEKILNGIIGKLSMYDFSEKVEERIIDFFSDRIDKKDIPGEYQIIATLDSLANASEREQLEGIENSIKGGWKTIYLPKDTTQKQSYRIDTGQKESYKEQKERVEKMNNDETLNRF
jgi:hypothetical protein